MWERLISTNAEGANIPITSQAKGPHDIYTLENKRNFSFYRRSKPSEIKVNLSGSMTERAINFPCYGDIMLPAQSREFSVLPVLTKKDYLVGYIELFLAQVCIGINVITGKLLTGFFPVFLLLAIRFTIGLCGMLVIMHVQRISIMMIYNRFMLLANKSKFLLFVQAICGGFLFNVFMLYGMKTISATSAGIISSIIPIMIFIISAVFLNEKINFQKIISIVIVVMGFIILNTGRRFDETERACVGNFLVLLAVIPEALFTILSKSINKKISSIEAVTFINLFNFILFLPFALINLTHFHLTHLNANLCSQLLLYGLSGGILFFFFWYRGLTKINANTAALFTGIMPLSTTLLAFIFLNETISINQIIGMLLVTAAIFIGCEKPHAESKKMQHIK